MRRTSSLLAFAAILLTAAVAYTYKLRLDNDIRHKVHAAPQVRTGDETVADRGWVWDKDDPQTNKPVVRLRARSVRATKDPSTFELHEMALRLYEKTGATYTYVRSGAALYDEKSRVMRSEGPVTIIRNVPADKDAENQNDIAKLVQIQTSGVTYETQTGKAESDQPASFKFPQGDGQGVGVAYDPATGDLHLKSKVSLDWIGNGPAENRMHIEAGDLVYKEREQKIYLSPWSKLHRQGTAIQARSSVVTLQDGVLHQVDADQACGTDVRDDKQTDYSAHTMTAVFDDNGVLINIVGTGDAKVVSAQQSSRTTITGQRADLRFAVSTKQLNGQTQQESDLHQVLADGHAVVESDPLPQPGVQVAETRILRSEHIELEMKPDGKNVQMIRAPQQAQLEFKPNRPDQSHRILDAARLEILYGEGSYIDGFHAWHASTHTDKPQSRSKTGNAKDAEPSAPALTWSDELLAKFTPNSNQVARIEQTGNFRYEEGPRKATAKSAVLEQTINRITLMDNARVSDDTGSADADKIVMNQSSGDMDSMGHVVSTHAPDKNQKPGTSMLDNSKSMQAKADQMETRENNNKIFYQGHVVMWQGANRISANAIYIDRDAQSLHAAGNVVSELVDNNSNAGAQPGSAAQPVFTVVYAPELSYRDDLRTADYTGGVKLVRDKMTVTSKTLKAFLTPKTANSNDSSLDHAFADGEVVIHQIVSPIRTRTGTAQHAEYYTKLNKVVLNGGNPQMQDSYKGLTKGQQLTYFSDDDRLIVDGEKNQLAFTRMRKK